jgi:hypothetical protein
VQESHGKMLKDWIKGITGELLVAGLSCITCLQGCGVLSGAMMSTVTMCGFGQPVRWCSSHLVHVLACVRFVVISSKPSMQAAEVTHPVRGLSG